MTLKKKMPKTPACGLVSDNKDPQSDPEIDKQFVNFMFFRVNPEWRKLNRETKKRFQV